jgi:hypothetical protein
MSRRLFACGSALLVIAGCSSPPPPTSASVAPASATPVAASAGIVDDGSAEAKTCSTTGLHWLREVTINPKMTLSNDGYCEAHVHLLSNTGIMMQVETPPQHGHVTTSGAYTSRAAVRYYPDKGYVGSDSFVVETGSARHAILADFAVTGTD